MIVGQKPLVFSTLIVVAVLESKPPSMVNRSTIMQPRYTSEYPANGSLYLIYQYSNKQ